MTHAAPDPLSATPATLVLRRREERRVRAGHPWVYANEVDTTRSPLAAFEPGDDVDVVSHQGRWLGSGYVNPRSLIVARIASRDPKHRLDRSMIVHRLNVARALRERLYGGDCYRLAFGESDGLPGLIVDRFADVFAVQITTAGMERRRDDVVAAIEKVFGPRAVLLRNDVPVRELEGLECYVADALGEAPAEIEVEESGLRFTAPFRSGQKTGWYYDQRDNRAAAAPLTRGARVLDAFSYVGGFGIAAAHAGASAVTLADSSAEALEHARRNASANGVGERVTTECGDVPELLKRLRAARERFDVVILDPPAFVKRKRDLQQGSIAYQRLNQAAMQVLERDGLLVTSSCSYHLHRDQFLGLLQKAAAHVDRALQVVREGHQAGDHPFHPAMPETAYLKTFVLRVLPRF